MEYAFDYGGVEQQILRDCRMSGMPIPDAIKNKPILIDDSLDIYLRAFWELDSARSVGMSYGRIPWTAIAQYAQFHGFDAAQTELLVSAIGQFDTAHLTRANKVKPK